MPQNNPPILLENPPASMPEKGSKDYELLLEETGGASANEGFNYAAHIAATRSTPAPAPVQKPDLDPDPDPDPGLEDIPIVPRHLPFKDPPTSMPEVGSQDYELLLEETGGASANEGFDYAAHMADRSELLQLIADASNATPDGTPHETPESVLAAILGTGTPEPTPGPPTIPDPTRDPANADQERDPNGNLIAPIYLKNPPASLPEKGTVEYSLLALEKKEAIHYLLHELFQLFLNQHQCH